MSQRQVDNHQMVVQRYTAVTSFLSVTNQTNNVCQPRILQVSFELAAIINRSPSSSLVESDDVITDVVTSRRLVPMVLGAQSIHKCTRPRAMPALELRKYGHSYSPMPPARIRPIQLVIVLRHLVTRAPPKSLCNRLDYNNMCT